MQRHTRAYLKHLGKGIDDVILCELCQRRATEIHHITFRSHQGTDEPGNLIALCREHHRRIHDRGDLPEERLREIVQRRDEYINQRNVQNLKSIRV